MTTIQERPAYSLPEHCSVPKPNLYRVSAAVGTVLLLRTVRDIHWLGVEKVAEHQGSAIIAPVHKDLSDPFVICEVMRRAADLQLHFMGKQGAFKYPISDWFLRSVGGFPVDRNESLQPETEEHISEIVSKNGLLGIFPEGTRRNGLPLRYSKIRRGAAIIALKHGVPIYPTGIAGTGKGDRKPVCVAVGDPIIVDRINDEINSLDQKQLVEASRPVRRQLYEGLVVAQGAAEDYRNQLINS